jgi:feruloyl esterase
VTLLHLGSLNAGRAVYADGGKAWLSPAKTKLITDAVYAKCDDLDGAKDGIISNVKACNAAFDPKTLRCANGAEGDTCLSDAQLGAVMRSARTTSLASPSPEWTRSRSGRCSKVRCSRCRTSARRRSRATRSTAVKHCSTPPAIRRPSSSSRRDPKLDTMTFDPTKWKDRIATVAGIMDVTDVSLAKFRAKGGKIIMTHGTADDFITPHNSIAYYQRQVKQFGQPTLDSFLRFYVIPGFGHGFGPFNTKFDSLTLLQEWVEKGRRRAALRQPTATRMRIGRGRCANGEVAQVHRRGRHREHAASFTCTAS